MNLGIFSGRLQLAVFKGTNLIRMEAIAKTEEQSVAYKYDAGFKGLPIKNGTRVVWRDLANVWDEYDLDGMKNENEVALKTANRIVIAEGTAGSIAAFPPPHTFFWARESDNNLGYSWYRKDNDSTFLFRRPAGRARRSATISGQFCALQRSLRDLAAHGHVLLREPG